MIRGSKQRTMIAAALTLGAGLVSGCAAPPRTPANQAAAMGRPAPHAQKQVHRLLEKASQDAFASLRQPDGFWNSPVARIGLPVLFERPGRTRNAALKSPQFRETLQHHLNTYAQAGAQIAEPLVAHALEKVHFAHPEALLNAGPTAATTDLRQQMGPILVNAMIPAILKAMQDSNDPVLTKAMSAVSGVTLADAAHALALGADSAIWYQIGVSESAIRKGTDGPLHPLSL